MLVGMCYFCCSSWKNPDYLPKSCYVGKTIVPVINGSSNLLDQSQARKIVPRWLIRRLMRLRQVYSAEASVLRLFHEAERNIQVLKISPRYNLAWSFCPCGILHIDKAFNARCAPNNPRRSWIAFHPKLHLLGYRWM